MDTVRVSSVQAAGGIVVGRILPGTDLITGILRICKENDLKFGNMLQ